MDYRDDKIRAAMAAKRLTQDEVAEKVGIARTTLHFICNGKSDPKVSTLMAVAKVLEIPFVDLFEE
jgi:DNA-binding XRE family transcriptional regulator